MSAPVQPYSGIEASGVGPGRLRRVERNADRLLAYAGNDLARWRNVLVDESVLTLGMEGLFDGLGIKDPTKSYGIIGVPSTSFSMIRGYVARHYTAALNPRDQTWRVVLNYQDNRTRAMFGREYLLNRTGEQGWRLPIQGVSVIDPQVNLRKTYTPPELLTPFPHPEQHMTVVTNSPHEAMFQHVAMIGDEVSPEAIFTDLLPLIDGTTYELQGRVEHRVS